MNSSSRTSGGSGMTDVGHFCDRYFFQHHCGTIATIVLAATLVTGLRSM